MKKLTLPLLLFVMFACTSRKITPPGSSLDPAMNPVPASAQVSWAASTGNPLGYTVDVSGDGSNWTSVATTTNTVTTTKVTGLVVAKHYTVRVKAFNPGGNSPYATLSVDP